jgi:hypothetical protein
VEHGGGAALLTAPAVPADPVGYGRLLAALAIAAGTLAMRVPSLTEPPWYYDDGVFTSVAWATSKGVPLYSGVYDLQPPGIYWLYRLLIASGAGEHHYVVQVAAAIAVVAIALLTFEIARRGMPVRLAVFAAGLTGFALGLPTLDGDLLNVEVVALPFFMAGLLVAFSRSAAAVWVSGALVGMAIVVRPSFALDGLALLVPLLGVGPRLLRLLLAGAGLAAAAALALAVLWVQGSLQPYFAMVVPSDHIYALRANGGSFTPLFVRLAALGILALVGLVRAKTQLGRLIAVWLPASVAGASLTPLEFTHFAHGAIPALAIAIAWLTGRLRPRWYGPLAAVVALVVCVELVLILPAQQTAAMQSRPAPRPLLHNIGFEKLPGYYANWFAYAFRAESRAQYAGYFAEVTRQNAEVALLRHLAPSSGARLVVLGSRSWLYVESGLLPATPYVATCVESCIVASEPGDIRRSLDAGCADIVVAVGQLEAWRSDLDTGGYIEVAGAPWPTFQSSRAPCK